MAAMLATLVVLAAMTVGRGSADCDVKCSAQDETSVSVVSGDLEARYVVSYCAAAQPAPAKWELVMSTLKEPKERCTYHTLGENRAGVSHSNSVETFEKPLDLNCSFVCFSKSMDLMFHSCYRLENKLSRRGLRGIIMSQPNNTYFFADNNVTGYPDPVTQYYTSHDYEEMVVFHWLPGPIPITDFEVMMWPNLTHNEEEFSVTRNCSLQTDGSLQCALVLAPGCYVLHLRHAAPWTKGYSRLARHTATFCHSAPSPPVVSARAGAGVWAGGAAGVLLACSLLAGLLAYHKRQQAKTKLRVWQDWLANMAEAEAKRPAEGGAGAGAGAGRVLLLYARDCAPAAALAARLRDVLAGAAGAAGGSGLVYDLYSPEVTALAARAPAAWVRACMTSPDTRVVLLQTPALAALHAVRLADGADTVKLSEPLLPRRVVYRSPLFGDSLLQFSLQLLAETSHTQPAPPYRKYFLATVSELAVDVFPTVVPYTRFELPAAATTLVQALWPRASVSENNIAELTAATANLVEFVREHPNYLADELTFL